MGFFGTKFDPQKFIFETKFRRKKIGTLPDKYWGEVRVSGPNVNFCLIWGAPPLFLPKIEFWLRGGGRFSPLITIFCWSEVTLKF